VPQACQDLLSSGADRGRFGRGPPEAGDYATNLACWHRCGIVELACSCIGLACKSPGVQSSNRSATYDWSGFYLGVNFGGGWSNGSLNISGNNLYGGLTEFIGGVQAGYNLEAGASYLVSKVISIGLASVIQCFLLRHWVM
jgi:hypothetical protein